MLEIIFLLNHERCITTARKEQLWTWLPLNWLMNKTEDSAVFIYSDGKWMLGWSCNHITLPRSTDDLSVNFYSGRQTLTKRGTASRYSAESYCDRFGKDFCSILDAICPKKNVHIRFLFFSPVLHLMICLIKFLFFSLGKSTDVPVYEFWSSWQYTYGCELHPNRYFVCLHRQILEEVKALPSWT